MGQAASLCKYVQGVQFTVDAPASAGVRALILRDALERFFGASDDPGTWLESYLCFQDLIDDAVLRRHRREPDLPLVLLRGDRPEDFLFGALPRLA